MGIWRMLIEMLIGLNHLHSSKLIHRDIKAANIFIGQNGTLKIGDLGVVRELDYTLDMATSEAGTPYYLSPEMIKGKPYNFKTDVWSLGVLLYWLCTHRPPFNARNKLTLYFNIAAGKYDPISKEHYSKELT